MIQLINIVKVPNTEPQKYRLHFKDAEKHSLRKGYEFESLDGYEAELRERMKNGGMSDAEIDAWFAQVK